MEPIIFSSGDLLADRRADYAEALAASGDHAAAADLLRDALSLAPLWTAGWYRLGEICQRSGQLEAAAQAWRECLRLDPDDRLGAVLKLALAGQAERIDAPPAAFVETLFDQYADDFDAALVERLGYRAPELIAETLAAAGRDRFGHVLDLGCGTGLMGERLRARTSFLEGVDLSAGMLRRARAKRLYDQLDRADLQLWQPPARPVDLIVAADVLNYLGRLDRLVAAVAAGLEPGGLFAFSVEAHDGPEPLALRESRRFAHSERHLRDLLAANCLEIAALRRETIRMDRGEPVEGLIVVAELKGEGAADTHRLPSSESEKGSAPPALGDDFVPV